MSKDNDKNKQQKAVYAIITLALPTSKLKKRKPDKRKRRLKQIITLTETGRPQVIITHLA